MKDINIFINEELNKHPIWCDVVMMMFQNSKNLTKEEISNMIYSFCDVEGRFKKFSDYLYDKFPKEYLAYQPNNDEFLKKENYNKICDQIAEFINKIIIK